LADIHASEISPQGAKTRDTAPTAPNSKRPSIEIQARAANATGVFMLLCVVMMT
jgi:hypothetical protein